MRLFSTTALSLAVVASMGLIVPSSAFAAKKKEEEKKEEGAAAQQGNPLNLSEAYSKAILPVQNALKASDMATAKAGFPAAEAAVTNADDGYHYGLILLQYSNTTKDKTVQREALERLVASERTPQQDVGTFAQYLGQSYLVEDRNFEKAAATLQRAVDNGATGSATYYQLAESKFGMAVERSGGSTINDANKPLAVEGLKDLKKAIDTPMADGSPTPISFYDRGFKIARVASPDTVLDWGAMLLKVQPTKENWNTVLLALYDANREVGRQEALDLFRLMRETKALSTANEYNAYAEAAWKLGLPGEVKALYDSGRAAGVINAQDGADLYKMASEGVDKDEASLAGSATNAKAAETGKSASATANAYIGYSDFAKAAELLRVAKDKGGVDNDEVNTRLGIALAHTGDKAGAKEAFGAVSGSGFRRQLANLWTVWLENQG